MEGGRGIEPLLGPNLGHTRYKLVGASSYTNLPKMVPRAGLEPASLSAADFKSAVFAISPPGYWLARKDSNLRPIG